MNVNPSQFQERPSITVVETVYHRRPGCMPEAVDSRFNRELESTEQPYVRQLLITEEWTALDSGWLSENVGMLHLSNDEGKRRSVAPSKQQLAVTKEKVIEICGTVETGASLWLIPPGESMRGLPSGDMKLRCRSGSAKCTLTIFPK